MWGRVYGVISPNYKKKYADRGPLPAQNQCRRENQKVKGPKERWEYRAYLIFSCWLDRDIFAGSDVPNILLKGAIHSGAGRVLKLGANTNYGNPNYATRHHGWRVAYEFFFENSPLRSQENNLKLWNIRLLSLDIIENFFQVIVFFFKTNFIQKKVRQYNGEENSLDRKKCTLGLNS